VARAAGNRTRRGVADPRDPFARFTDLFDGPGRVGGCAHGDAGQSGRGRGLCRRQPRDAQRRAGLARRDARFAQGDQPAAPVLRACDFRELANALCSRRRTVADHSGITRSRRSHCRRIGGSPFRALPLRRPDGRVSRSADDWRRVTGDLGRRPPVSGARYCDLSFGRDGRRRPSRIAPDHPCYNGWRG
jgi:hypothetical protein